MCFNISTTEMWIEYRINLNIRSLVVVVILTRSTLILNKETNSNFPCHEMQLYLKSIKDKFWIVSVRSDVLLVCGLEFWIMDNFIIILLPFSIPQNTLPFKIPIFLLSWILASLCQHWVFSCQLLVSNVLHSLPELCSV